MNERMHNGIAKGWLALIGACALVASPWAAAQRPTVPVAETPAAAPVPAATAEQVDELDEVVINGGRVYDRIVKAEERFFALYNEINKDDDFDTNCANLRVESDSRIEQRFCMPSFFADAKAEEVRLSQYCLSLQTKDEEGNAQSGGACYMPPAAEAIFFARRKAYVENVIEVIKSNPALIRAYTEVELLHRERAMLSNRYDELKRQKVIDQSNKSKDKKSTVH